MFELKAYKRKTALAGLLVSCLLIPLRSQGQTTPASDTSPSNPPAVSAPTSPGTTQPSTASVAPVAAPAKDSKPKTAPVAAQPGKDAKDSGVIVKVKEWVLARWNEFRDSMPEAVGGRLNSASPLSTAKAKAGTATNKGHRSPASAAPSVGGAGTNGSAPAFAAGSMNVNLPTAANDANGVAAAAGEPVVTGATTTTPNNQNLLAAGSNGSPAAVPETSSINALPVLRDIPKAESGVQVYALTPNVESIPRLGIDEETAISAKQYLLSSDQLGLFDGMVASQKDSPAVLTAKEMMDLKRVPKAAGAIEKIKMVVFNPKGKVKREAFDNIVLTRTLENLLVLAKYVPLTQDELRMLSGLLLFQAGDKCAVAIGLFHQLAKTAKYDAEGNYYLAMCSRKLGLMTDFTERARRVLLTQDPHYSKKIMTHVSPDIPYEFIEPFGQALAKAATNKELMKFDTDAVAGNMYYVLANYGAQTGNFKMAQANAKMVPETHAKWPQAQFILALSEYQIGSKAVALSLQEELVAKLDTDKTKAEFQTLVAANLARMYFQEQKFKESRDWFLKVYKDHPLWLQSLQEMGWSQLQMGDYAGAIGNMYSVQSPYFNSVYKPESYVIRTIGYLNLCQYGDAYRTLSILEKQYRPWLSKMTSYQKATPDYMSTVRKFISLKTSSAEIDGLPAQVIREIVRHREYTNLQNSLNRQIDERDRYAALDADVDKSIKRSRWLVNNSRKRADQLRDKIASIKKNPQLEQNRPMWKSELDNELDLLNGYFFEIDLFNEAKSTLQAYKNEVVAGADSRMTKMRGRIVTVLADRLKRVESDLARMLENNELLRYEVFAGSGENIRFQVAGGEQTNRVPADVLPKSKTLQWDFDGEYWEDEIGHYRSSLKNMCPDAANLEHASL